MTSLVTSVPVGNPVPLAVAPLVHYAVVVCPAIIVILWTGHSPSVVAGARCAGGPVVFHIGAEESSRHLLLKL